MASVPRDKIEDRLHIKKKKKRKVLSSRVLPNMRLQVYIENHSKENLTNSLSYIFGT